MGVLEAAFWHFWGRHRGRPDRGRVQVDGVAVMEHKEIRKPGWGHPIVLLFWAVVAAHVGLLLWLASLLFE